MRLLLTFLALLCGSGTGYGQMGLTVSLDRFAFLQNEEIIADVVVNPGGTCVTFDPTITTRCYSMILEDGDGILVDQRDLTIDFDFSICNFSTFCNIDHVKSTVSLTEKFGRDLFGPYYVLSPGYYCLKVFYDAGGVVASVGIDPSSEGCLNQIGRSDFVLEAESNRVCFEVLGGCPPQELHPADQRAPKDPKPTTDDTEKGN